MEDLSKCILSVVAAAVINSIIIGLSATGKYTKPLQMLCGLFLLLTVLGNNQSIQLEWPELSVTDGEREAAYGEKLAIQALCQRISEDVQSYIRDKGRALGIELSVVVTLNDELLPETVSLTGPVSEETKQTLSQMLTEELGIKKENQIWIG